MAKDKNPNPIKIKIGPWLIPGALIIFFIVFSISLLIMIAAVLYEVVVKKIKISIINFLIGALVGVFNFSNIFFYLKAHQAFAKNPSTVFAAMNMGVIVVGSLVGVIAFKEKLSTKNYIGLIFALVAIILITASQIGS